MGFLDKFIYVHKDGPRDFSDLNGCIVPTKDLLLEAEKRGYSRAKSEYEPIYNEANAQCKALKISFEDYKNDTTSDLQFLNNEKKRLEIECDKLKKNYDNMKQLLNGHGLPSNLLSCISTSSIAPLGITTNYIPGFILFDVIDFLYKHNKEKQAEAKGYNTAKKEYQSKINAIKDELEKIESQIKTYKADAYDLRYDILERIVMLQDEITTLKINIATLSLMKWGENRWMK